MSTEATIDRIRSLLMAREAVPLEHWQAALDMLTVCLFRDPDGMGLPATQRAVFEGLFVRPITGGMSLPDTADFLRSWGANVFGFASTRAELRDFIGHVERALAGIRPFNTISARP